VDGSSTGTEVPWMWVLLRPHDSEEPNMQAVTTIGLDIAKSIFQIHGVDAAGNVIVRRQLERRYVCAAGEQIGNTATFRGKPRRNGKLAAQHRLPAVYFERAFVAATQSRTANARSRCDARRAGVPLRTHSTIAKPIQGAAPASSSAPAAFPGRRCMTFRQCPANPECPNSIRRQQSKEQQS
jgi:hypothetical protein